MVRRFLGSLLVFLCLLPGVAACLGNAPQNTAGNAAGGRQRLILKDGSYQVVSRYEVKNGRVRFRSIERDDGWEELPADLVDWPATERYNHEHVPGAVPEPGSPASQEAAELDRQAAAQRADEAARQPEVAPGLRLPDESGIWALDSFNNTPELLRIHQSDGDLNTDLGHTVKALAIPQGGARDFIHLQGYKAAVEFHVARPVFFIALDVKNGAAREDALVVDTHGASSLKPTGVKDTSQKASPSSTYALVRLRVWKNQRAASGVELRGLGTGGVADGSAEVVATERTILPGGHWMRITPRSDLNLGQYSLVELLGGGAFNLDGWDFGVNPMAPENKGGFAPVDRGGSEP